MAAAVKTAPNLSTETPKLVFKSIYAGYSHIAGTPYDIHPDGKRFLMIKLPQSSASSGETPRKINIVLNWFEELKQKVPVK